MKLNIIVKENSNQNITLFLDDVALGDIEGDFNQEIELDKKTSDLYFKSGDKKSNVFKLESENEEYELEIDKAFKIKQMPPMMILRVLIPLFMMCFCAHMAIGIGYYLFGVVSLLFVTMLIVNKNKLVIRKEQK